MFNEKRINLTDDGRVYYVPLCWSDSWEMPQLNKRPAVLLCPGGGYGFTSDREADPVGFQYLAAGFSVFVLRYSVNPYCGWPNPICDLMRCMKSIRDHADEYGIDPDRIAVGGFSAGGHLAATLGVYWNDEELCKIAGVTPEEVKPNALILYYPVIMGSGQTHVGSINGLMKDLPQDQWESFRDKLSLEKHVGPHTPPTILFSSFYDECVPCECSMEFARALLKNEVAFELHIEQDGVHGLATGDQLTNPAYNFGAAEWADRAIIWLKRLFGFLPSAIQQSESGLTRRRNIVR